MPRSHGLRVLMATTTCALDLERLLKLRLVVARHGEMDGARWWNTTGALGPQGAFVYRRGFPKTHRLAQARVVFRVAAHRCLEVYDTSRFPSMTLWQIPAALEDAFETQWARWIDEVARLEAFFKQVETLPGGDLLAVFAKLGLAKEADLEKASRLKRGADNRAVPLPGTHTPTDDVLTQLALGFFRGEPGNPAIPFARLEA